MKITASFLESKKDSKAELPLSVSKAKTFDQCKAKYYYTYIKKLPRKEWDFQVYGQFVHDILERFHANLIDDSSHDHYDLMTSCFAESIEAYNKKLSKKQKKEAQELITGYLDKLSREKESKKKLPNILAVERHFYIDIGEFVLLNGFIDVVQKDPDGVLHVADYKTTKDKRYLKDFFQLLTYAYVLMLENSRLKKIRASYILLRHNFEYVTKEYTRSEVMKIQDEFIEYANKIQSEQLWRPSPQFLCKYCDHMDRCSEGKDYLIKRGIIDIPQYGISEW